MPRANRHLLISLAAATCTLALPSVGLAAGGSGSSGNPGSSSGGAGVSGSPGSSGGGTSSGGGSGSGSRTNQLVQPANQTISARGNGITIRTRESGLLRGKLRFSGTAPRADAGEVIQIERSAGAGWSRAARATVSSSGAFSVVWHANRAGRLDFKAVVLPSPAARPATDSSSATPSSAPSSPALAVTVYRLSTATFYGPGFFGHRTACGQTLHRNTLGVANRTLPCGAHVSILFDGHSIVVPVIDRGPYGTHAYWDLTQATARALGMTGTSRIGTLF